MSEGMKATLGSYLRSLRGASGLSLRDAELKSGISNAFLSQLESGKVKQPSPIMLHKLSELYGVPYEALMRRAGYPFPEIKASTERSTPAASHRLGNLSEQEEDALLDYLSFLRVRARKERRTK